MHYNRMSIGIVKCRRHITGMVYCGTKHHGFTIAGLVFPVLYDGLIDGGVVHDCTHFRHIKFINATLHFGQRFLSTDINHKGARGYQMPGLDEFSQ